MHDSSSIEQWIDQALAGEALPAPEVGEAPALAKLRRLVDRVEHAERAQRLHAQAMEALASSLMRLAQLDFDVSLQLDHEDDLVNATFMGVAMLAEELAHAHAELERARDNAVAASRSKSSFLANMSHELRTPLNAIIGYCELMQDECDDNPALGVISGDLGKVLVAANHLLRLISDVLDLSKIEAGRIEIEVERTTLAPMLREVLDTLSGEAESKGIAIELDIQDDPMVDADLLRMKQVVLNLTSNAVKFTHRGAVRVGLRRRGGYVLLEVRDTGIGIPDDRLGAIFDPFVQAGKETTRKFGGTGLGLAISRELVRLMGGDLVVTSKLGEGSTFTAELPVLAMVDDTGDTRRSSILVVDDDPTFHGIVRRYLVGLDCDIRTCLNGQEALERVRERQPDLIILDIVMPTLDGWDTLTQLKADPELEAIPVVLVSVLDERSDPRPLRAVDYLVKPVSRDALIGIINRVLSHERRSVLVVDDEPRARELVRRQLERLGCDVVEAFDGRDALDQMAVSMPDLVLMDLQMPRMDGFECTAAMAQDPDLCEIPIVVLTGMDLDGDQRRALAGRVTSVVAKGLGSDALVQSVRAAMGSNTIVEAF